MGIAEAQLSTHTCTRWRPQQPRKPSQPITHAPRVSQVVGQVVDGPLPGGNILPHKPLGTRVGSGGRAVA